MNIARVVFILTATLGVAALTACQAGIAPTLSPASQTQSSHIAGRAAGGDLYVANGKSKAITVYGSDTNLKYKIKLKGEPRVVTLDASGNIYVADSGGASGEVVEYDPNTQTVQRTITDGIHRPFSLAFDASGNLYVANHLSRGQKGSVTVYPPTGTTMLREITDGVSRPISVTFDKNGNLYVLNSGTTNVTVYAPGASTPKQTISDKIEHPLTMAYGNDRLFVGNNPKPVNVYTHDAKLAKQIGKDVLKPAALAIGSGNLFVANSEAGTVTVYNAQTGKHLRTISKGTASPTSLALDPDGFVYVGNPPANDVTVYAPGGGGIVRTYSTDINDPVSLAVGPG